MRIRQKEKVFPVAGDETVTEKPLPLETKVRHRPSSRSPRGCANENSDEDDQEFAHLGRTYGVNASVLLGINSTSFAFIVKSIHSGIDSLWRIRNSDSSSSMYRWIARRNGRAPEFDSSSARESSQSMTESSIANWTPFCTSAMLTSSTSRRQIARSSFCVSGLKMMMSSMRLMNSGLNSFFSS